jgi:probable rRNA maturation factor
VRRATVTRADARARLALAVQYAAPRAGLPARRSLARWLGAALGRAARVTVRFVGAVEGRRLNREYRGRDYATNVLTFVYDAGRGGALAGDIVLCAPVVAREARAQRLTPRARYAHLAVHGALHLQGYDHERTADAKRMEARERTILARLGFADPYGRRAG